MEQVTRYPLAWPAGLARTPAGKREQGRFKVSSFNRIGRELVHEVELLGGRGVVLSTNVEINTFGEPYTRQKAPDDPGVAIYWGGKRRGSMACDRWLKVEHNLRALQLSIAAIRGLNRWGGSAIRDRAFAGFSALPPAGDDWRSVLGFARTMIVTPDMVKERYRARARVAHPDRDGNEHEMIRINQALEAARREIGF